MSNLPLEVVEVFGQTIAKVVPVTIVLALVFSVLTAFLGLQSRQALVAQARTRHRRLLLVLRAAVWARAAGSACWCSAPGSLFNIHDADELIAFYDNGHGPLSDFRSGSRRCCSSVLSDFMLYWLHRMFHGGGFWKYHAIHHSSEDLDWISAARFHPVNLFLGTILVDVILLIAGISPNVMLWVGPFTIFHSAFVHANLSWTLGPFKYVLATPVFHRWHHTALEQGGNTNFAGTFPLWDILFGTFRMPEGKLPDNYGVDDQAIFRARSSGNWPIRSVTSASSGKARAGTRTRKLIAT